MDCVNLESIEFSPDLMHLANSVFENCLKLTLAFIPEKVSGIGTRVFYNCQSITTMFYPLNKVETEQFYNCKSLKKLILKEQLLQIRDYGFYGCESLENIDIDYHLSTLGKHAFEGCKSLTSVNLSGYITYLNEYTFKDCYSLEVVNITEDGLSGIYDGAFQNCYKLVSINLPTELGRLGDAIFVNCTSLKSLILPDGFVQIPERMFEGCSSFCEFNWTRPFDQISSRAFAGTNFSSIVFENSLKGLYEDAFDDCNNLKSVTFPFQDMEYTRSPFSKCKNLEKIVLVDTIHFITTIQNNLFGNCQNVKEIIVDSVYLDVIEPLAFVNCFNLESVSLTSKAKNLTVPSGLFNTSLHLSNLKINCSLLVLTDETFKNSQSLSSVTFSVEEISFGKSLFENCSSLKSFEFNFKTADLPSKLFNGCSSLSEVKLNGEIKEIGDHCFHSCVSLETIKLTGKQLKIGPHSFCSCYKLNNVNINCDSVTFDNYCFNQCQKLSNFDLNTQNILSIGQCSFFNTPFDSLHVKGDLTKIGEMSFKSSHIKNIEIETNNDIIIGAHSFCECLDLVSVKITSKSIIFDDYCFNQCQKLSKLDLTESKVTSIGNYSFYNTSSLNIDLNLKGDIKFIGECSFKSSMISKLILDTTQDLVVSNHSFCSCMNLNEFTTKGNVILNSFAFHNCQKLSLFNCLSVLSLSTASFANCSMLSKVVIKTNIIPDHAFEGCEKLSDFTFAENVTKFGDYSFYKSGIEKVNVYSSITMFGNYVFSNCAKLSSVKILSNHSDFGNSVFENSQELNEFYYCGNQTSVPSNVLSGCSKVTAVYTSSSFKDEKFAGIDTKHSDVCGNDSDNQKSKTVKIVVISSIASLIVVIIIAIAIVFACKRRKPSSVAPSTIPLLTNE
ncbi:surface antigen BspA-like [Trichomonas vaginalis G3]|uniref:Surface antigen BspA-like n=1 Tax=Trichomonas vaginalis (strain ATCC PRA-98 / G3) TaxID=412133 RepID=A2FCF4_TRIV3|nr:antigen BSP-related family [Trichomonas vaginalis G3]EAX97414.1 surface antigen BspA-like [Trichomonas vaginalis G3]KAI5516888.1 antigen BSP-related family [Trichomonas vaginalis G3]|eukprot:XP_001310344.1 surface antigen BspA-like [Trichomonas vaginalis G3]